MARSIHDVIEIALPSCILEQHGERRILDTNLSIDLILSIVSPFVFFVQIPSSLWIVRYMSLLDDHVTQQSLTMMQMSTDRDISDKVRLLRQRGKVL